MASSLCSLIVTSHLNIDLYPSFVCWAYSSMDGNEVPYWASRMTFTFALTPGGVGKIAMCVFVPFMSFFSNDCPSRRSISTPSRRCIPASPFAAAGAVLGVIHGRSCAQQQTDADMRLTANMYFNLLISLCPFWVVSE